MSIGYFAPFGCYDDGDDFDGLPTPTNEQRAEMLKTEREETRLRWGVRLEADGWMSAPSDQDLKELIDPPSYGPPFSPKRRQNLVHVSRVAKILASKGLDAAIADACVGAEWASAQIETLITEWSSK